MKGQVPEDYYDNFLLVFVGIHCLISRSLYKTHADYAHTRLYAFIEQARILYGTEFIVYNVHGLTHISEDVKRFGSLDEHSAFPFDNFLGHLKMLLRKPQFPLQQIIRRVIERQGIVTRQTPKTIIPDNIPQKEHFHGPVPLGFLQCLQFQNIYLNGLFSLLRTVTTV
jgi:hypothetical protein